MVKKSGEQIIAEATPELNYLKWRLMYRRKASLLHRPMNISNTNAT
jgi:hypothetical protein